MSWDDEDDVGQKSHYMNVGLYTSQAVQSASGVAVGQRIGSGSWGVGSSPRSGATNLDAVQHYAGLAAKTSGRHMKSLGEAGYKYLSSQVFGAC